MPQVMVDDFDRPPWCGIGSGRSTASTAMVRGRSSTVMARCWRCTSRSETYAKPAVVMRAERTTAAFARRGSVPHRADRHRPRLAAVGRRAHRGDDRRLRRRPRRPSGGDRRRSARLRRAPARRRRVVTFDRHPASVVRPESAPKLLTDHRPEARAARRDGYRRHRRRATSTRQQCHEEPPEDFVERVLVDCLATRGRRRRARTSTSAATARATSTLLRELGADGRLRGRAASRSSPRADGVDEPSARPPSAGRSPAARSSWPPSCSAGRTRPAGIVVAGDQRGRLLGFPTANVEVPNAVCLPGRRRVRRLVRAARRRRAPVRHQPRSPADVLRARRPLAARGAPARLRRRPLRRAGRGALRALPAQRAQVRRHRRARRAAQARRRTRPQRCWRPRAACRAV